MKKKILFIAYKYLDLYKEIQNILEYKGYEVQLIEDKHIGFCPSFIKNRFIKKILKNTIWNYKVNKHWNKLKNILNNDYSYVLILSGVSINKSALNLIRKNNPKASFSYYTFDNISYYNSLIFKKNYINFFTFDIKDANKYNLNFLPIFWKNSNETISIKYKIFAFGSDHDGRKDFYKKILLQLKQSKKNYYIKIFNKDQSKSELYTKEPLPINNYIKILSESEIILDDCRENQSGLTARFMWALGLGKKIITTNPYVYMYPFVNKEQVLIIDKNNPFLNLSYFKEFHYSNSSILKYRLDNWINIFLNSNVN